MDRLPTEIHERIFALACVEDPTARRTLALVSRSVSDSSRPARFSTIAVCGYHSIRGFLAVLARDPSAGALVRNLFVSDCAVGAETADALGEWSTEYEDTPATSTASTIRTSFARILRAVKKPKRKAPLVRGHERQIALHEALATILGATARTLRTLTVAAYMMDTDMVPRETMPLLEELSVLVLDGTVFRAGFGSAADQRDKEYKEKHQDALWLLPAAALPVFPALTRLHLSPVLLPVVTEIARIAPGLTHLRFSNVDYAETTFVPMLLGLPYEQPPFWDGTELPPLPPSAERMVVQTAEANHWMCGCMASTHHTMVASLRPLPEQDPAGRLILIEAPRRYNLNDAFEDWAGRLSGGMAYWAPRPSEESPPPPVGVIFESIESAPPA